MSKGLRTQAGIIAQLPQLVEGSHEDRAIMPEMPPFSPSTLSQAYVSKVRASWVMRRDLLGGGT